MLEIRIGMEAVDCGFIQEPETRALFNSRGDIPGLPGLPPRDVWLINPEDPLQKVETPTDFRGLIDIPGLIESVKETINPEYSWPRHL
ncbi:hypothetical protein BH23PAT2_BH23PAT2_07540 [soil metagenome]